MNKKEQEMKTSPAPPRWGAQGFRTYEHHRVPYVPMQISSLLARSSGRDAHKHILWRMGQPINMGFEGELLYRQNDLSILYSDSLYKYGQYFLDIQYSCFITYMKWTDISTHSLPEKSAFLSGLNE